MFKRIVHTVFFGNYFYGCCTVALAVEAALQQQLPLNSIFFYLLIFFSTVIFYTYAYIQEKQSASANPRNNWYIRNYKLIKQTQLTYFIVCIALAAYLFFKYLTGIKNITILQLILPLVGAFTASAYYGISFGLPAKINLRRTGWFKPFVIGFVWATMVTYIPLLWYQAEYNTAYHFSSFNAWFFIKNFMYISLLAILFDIKDYAADHNRQLKTFVVQMGIRKTIFYIIIPLTIFGFIAFIVFASLLHFYILRIIVNGIPFILLILVAWSLQKRKSILYYLIVIDGLMLVKALCGITASLLVK